MKTRAAVLSVMGTPAPYETSKPLVVEEVFPLNCTLADLDRFIDATDGTVEGWVSHYFGSTVAEHRAGAKPAGPLVAEFLEYSQRKGPHVAIEAVRRLRERGVDVHLSLLGAVFPGNEGYEAGLRANVQAQRLLGAA